MAALGLSCCMWAFSSCNKQRLSLVVVHGLLIVISSPVVEHRLCRLQASVVVVHGLTCPTACGIILDQDQTHVHCISRKILNH